MKTIIVKGCHNADDIDLFSCPFEYDCTCTLLDGEKTVGVGIRSNCSLIKEKAITIECQPEGTEQ